MLRELALGTLRKRWPRSIDRGFIALAPYSIASPAVLRERRTKASRLPDKFDVLFGDLGCSLALVTTPS